MQFLHQTVLLEESVSLMKAGAGRVIVDGTLGGGGHAEALLESGSNVIGFDMDPRAVDAARARLSRFGPRFRSVCGNFSEIEPALDRDGALPVDGVLLDLGVSSPQLDDPERGFSFQAEGPLDMRMGGEGPTAAEMIASLGERELADLIHGYGEERFARAIARSLKRVLPRTTQEAVEAVKRAVPRRAWPSRTHVATRTFQALRIAVNRELESLETAIDSLPRLLRRGGVAAIISFHSLEDRMVKEKFRDLAGRCTCPPAMPVCGCGAQGAFALLTRKSIVASESEVKRNPRSRSARLRAVEKMR